MLLAYVVYIGLMSAMVWCTGRWVYLRNRMSSFSFWNVRIVFPIVLFSIVIGLRYEVGIDYSNYYYSYLLQPSSGMPWGGIFEPGFVLLNRLLKHFHLPVYALFISVAFIQIVLFYKAFEKKPYLLSFAVLILFLTGQVFGMMNILRHFIAAMIVLMGVDFASKRSSLWKFLLCVICATLFHYSALIALPIAFLCVFPRPMFLEKRWVLLVIFLVVVLFQEILLSTALEKMISFLGDLNLSRAESLGFNTNKLSYAVGEFVLNEGTGYGRLMNYGIVLCLILVSGRLYKEFGMDYLNYFRIYYVGQLFLVIAGGDMNLRRVAMFYSLSGVVVMSYFFYYVYSHWKRLPQTYKLFGVLLFGYQSMLFLYKIYAGESACAPYKFII